MARNGGSVRCGASMKAALATFALLSHFCDGRPTMGSYHAHLTARVHSHEPYADESTPLTDFYNTATAPAVRPHRSLHEWERLADGPRAQEGSGLMVGPRLWVFGGLPFSDRVHIYDPSTGSWGDGPRLPYPVHHNLNTMVQAGDRLLVIGGVRGDDLTDCRALDRTCIHPNTEILTYQLPAGTHDLPDDIENHYFEPIPGARTVGGITSCASFPIDNLLYCYTGEPGAFIHLDDAVVPQTFFSFNVETFEVVHLPVPSIPRDHVSLIVDEGRRRILLTGGRQIEVARDAFGNRVPTKCQTGSSIDAYVIDFSVWEEGVATAPFEGVEARITFQVPGRPYVLFAGGQEMWIGNGVAYNGVSDVVLQLELATLSWSYVGDLQVPIYGMQCGVLDSDEGAVAYLHGGGLMVGPYTTNRFFKWDIADLLMRKSTVFTLDDRSRLQVISAFCDNWPVTDEVIRHLEERHGGRLSSYPTDTLENPYAVSAGICNSWGQKTGNLIPANVRLSITYMRHGEMVTKICDLHEVCVMDSGEVTPYGQTGDQPAVIHELVW